MTSDSPGTSTHTRWERLQELFARAVDLPEQEREAFVRQETADDAELREELLGLLACDTGKKTGPLTYALGEALDSTTRDRRRALIGRLVGNYKLVSVLGHGGTGTVYLGERADRQYSAQVAVKIVDSATVHGDLGMRFRAERQILASLNHANIARLLDAGETEDGQPYLVMEYVHGEPLDRYSDRVQLDVRKRLELFLEICTAVQYAHQNLVVHRDLKPANILVTSDGSPKLLDFGIAKLLDSDHAAAVLALTRMNDRLLTPEYASPEQILGRAVTTASDVYALGVVLYELLTGLRPYVVPASASQLELERSICINDPQRPSTAVRRAIEAGPAEEGRSNIHAIAQARGLTAEKLQRRLLGDIDAIVMRALRKEPQHRYGSIDQLAGDVRRYLANEPVTARQGNWLYYSQRFIRRNAVAVAAGVVFIAVAAAFTISLSIQMQRTAQERDRATQEGERAEKVSEFMLNVFAASDPFENPDPSKEITARELLERAARTIRGDLNEQPEVRARLLEAIGRAFRRQGQPDRAIAYLEDALHIRKQLSQPRDPHMGSLLAELAVAMRVAGRFEESDRMFQQALDIARTTESDRSIGYARLLVDLGRLEHERGHAERAATYLTQALDLTRELEGPRNAEVAAILNDLSGVRAWLDDLDGAERASREATSIYRETTPDMHPDRIVADYRLADVLYLKGQINEAGTILENTLRAQRLIYGNVNGYVADTLDSLAKVRADQGNLDEAEALAREAIATNAGARGAEHYGTAYLRQALAQILLKRSKYRDAETELRAALDIYAKTLPIDHQYVASAEFYLGEALLGTHQFREAETMLQASMNRWKRSDAPVWREARAANALAEALYRQGRVDAAEKYFVDSFRELQLAQNAPADIKQKAQERVTRFYTDRGQRHKLDELMMVTNRGSR